jgi:FKBP-type peptidyl-prolyl cis-trans isomerase (trigger factor)
LAFPIEIKKLPHSTVELRGEFSVEIFESFRTEALHALGQEVKLPGFRPGHIPDDVLTRELGEETVLRRMAELALNKYYPAILIENKIDALGRPNISLTKIAKGNPLGFVITTAVHPEVKLPDYRALARTTDVKDSPSSEGETLTSTVTDEEVSAAIKDIEKMPEPDRPKLPEAELREKIKESLTQEKIIKARDKRRLEMIEKIILATTIDLPPILIESETATMIAEMKHEVGRMGLPFDKYLEHLKKTEVDLKSEWRPQAEHRVKTGLILATIARVEKIEAPTEKLEAETKRLLTDHPKTDPARVRAYLASLMINEKVFQLLETA